MDLEQLHRAGWTPVEGVASRGDLLELGRALGRPVPSPSGGARPPTAADRRNRGSARHAEHLYGTGPFPLHTDTAFWPRPVRYVLLRAIGDTRRLTTVLSFAKLFDELGPRLRALAEKSVWSVRAGPQRFYCSLRFRVGELVGWRCDCDLMSPANQAALDVEGSLRPFLASGRAEVVCWSKDMAVVVSNWSAMHGRGPAPHDEGVRITERLYVG